MLRPPRRSGLETTELLASAGRAREAAHDHAEAARGERLRLEEVERAASRVAEATRRESAWEAAQAERLEVEARRAADALAAALGEATAADASGAGRAADDRGARRG